MHGEPLKFRNLFSFTFLSVNIEMFFANNVQFESEYLIIYTAKNLVDRLPKHNKMVNQKVDSIRR